MALTKRQVVDMIEKAVEDGKLPENILYQAEGGAPLKLDEKQVAIVLSYKDEIKAPKIPDNLMDNILKSRQRTERPAYEYEPPRYRIIDNRPRYTREEWQKLEMEEQRKSDAKFSFPKARRVIRCEG